MKKVIRTCLLFAAILLMATACSDSLEDIVEQKPTAPSNPMQSIIRTPDEALDIANKAVGMFAPSTESRAANTSKKLITTRGLLYAAEVSIPAQLKTP